jgi:hypothetical protein
MPTGINVGKDSSFPALAHHLDFYRSERTQRSDSLYQGEGDRKLGRFVRLVGIKGEADLTFRYLLYSVLRRLAQFD